MSNVSVGPTTILGVIATIAAAAGSVYSGVRSNDAAMVTAGVSAILTALATLGGRYAQAVTIARHVAHDARPIMNAIAEDDQRAW